MWYQLRIQGCAPDLVDFLSEHLEQTGALSITLLDQYDNPILEPELGTTPLWPETLLQVLYAKEDEANIAGEGLIQLFPYLQTSVQHVPAEDWESTFRASFPAQCFGERLWVCPTWLEPPQPKAINLMLDPGLAFGTGTHPTTSLCLKWLDKTALNEKTLIDYGCGSGILALAALKLGAQKVYALDIDEQALFATRQNASLNSFETPTHLIVDYPQMVHTPKVDIILANILLNPLMILKETFHSLLKEAGILVVSGILSRQLDTLLLAYDSNFTCHEVAHQEQWSMVAFQTK